GWLVGPLSWLGCAWLTARIVGLEPAPTLVRAVAAGLVSLLAVLIGLHWLGALVAVGLFAYLCAIDARVARRQEQGTQLGKEQWMSWGLADIPDQSGRTVVVTGANGGLGLETARALAGAGAEVVMAARNQQRAAEAMEQIRGDNPDARLTLVEL